jgi:hypothetical protein
LFNKKLYIFIGADGWRCLLTGGKRGIRELGFNTEPEERLRLFLRGVYVKKAWIILSSESTILRFTKLPLLKKRQMKKASAFFYEANFPVDKDKYIFDYRIIGRALDRYRLLLAALPAAKVSAITDLLKRRGIRIKRLWLFEDLGGLRLSEFNSILVFIRQETTWRVIWMKNKVPFEIWRISAPNDIKALFAELEYGETIDSGLFYSKPEDWITTACVEYGLAVVEALDPLDIFEERAESLNMLPILYKYAAVSRRALIAAAALLTLLAVSAFAVSMRLDAQTADMRLRNAELTSRIRSLNDSAGSQAAKLPPELEDKPYEYGRILKLLTKQLPPDARVSHVSAADGFIFLTVIADGGEWVNRYIEACRSDLGLSVEPSRIFQENDVTEMDLHIEVIR